MSRLAGLRVGRAQARVLSFRSGGAACYLLPALSVAPATTAVETAGDQVCIRYGPWWAAAGRGNICPVPAFAPYRAWKALGPRVSLADRDLTFGTSTRGGVGIQFWEQAGVLASRRLLAHPALTVTVGRASELVRLRRPSRLNLLSRHNLLSRATDRMPQAVGARS